MYVADGGGVLRWYLLTGVALAIMELVGVIPPVYSVSDRNALLRSGTVAAGWQNFFICFEMLAAAVALRFVDWPTVILSLHTILNTSIRSRHTVMYRQWAYTCMYLMLLRY